MPQTGVWRLAVVLAAACCVSACGVPSTAGTVSAPYSVHASTVPSTSTTVASRAAPGQALASYLHQIVAGDRRASCQDATPVASQVTLCMSAAGAPGFSSLHNSFVAIGIRPQTPIQVAVGDVTGASVTISASDVRVEGTTLLTLLVRHSTGIKPGQLSMSWILERVAGAWYVSNMNMNVG